MFGQEPIRGGVGQVFTKCRGVFNVNTVRTVLLRFPDWTTCFLDMVCNDVQRLWDAFSPVWWVCQRCYPISCDLYINPTVLKRHAQWIQWTVATPASHNGVFSTPLLPVKLTCCYALSSLNTAQVCLTCIPSRPIPLHFWLALTKRVSIFFFWHNGYLFFRQQAVDQMFTLLSLSTVLWLKGKVR